MEIPQYAQPIYRGNSDIGVLFCHGFTSSPWSLKEWAETVADAGYRVSLPRLPGHGTTWQEMNRVAWQDWYSCVDQDFRILQDQCRKVFVAGLSMGGTLALRLAEKHPDTAGLVLVNPAMQLPWNAHFAPLLRHFIPSIKAAVGSDIAMPGVYEYSYDVTPLNATNELLKMIMDVGAGLDLVTCPLLVYRSAIDHVLPPSSVQTVLRQVSSDDVTERVLARSWHVAPMDYDKEDIFAGSIDFFAKHSK